MNGLTPDQLEEFRLLLESARESAAALLDQTVGDIRPVDLNLPIGRLTRIDAIQMQAMAQMNRRQLEIRVQQIELALAAIDQGKYGLCRQCKQPIALERLRVLPESPFCIDCQEGFERGR